MEGPTPVSALIHAATMVTAGVYMMARSSVFYQHAPNAMLVVAVVSAAPRRSSLRPSDSSRTTSRRFSPTRRCRSSATCSSGWAWVRIAAAIFHLMTHAFFKACLFLGSGSVIHTMEHAEHAAGGHRRLHRDAGHAEHGRASEGTCPGRRGRSSSPPLAIAGIPPFAGFFSKDEILWKATARRSRHAALARRRHRRGDDRVLHDPPGHPDVLRRVPRRREDGVTPPRVAVVDDDPAHRAGGRLDPRGFVGLTVWDVADRTRFWRRR